jgi:hypothetical protein
LEDREDTEDSEEIGMDVWFSIDPPPLASEEEEMALAGEGLSSYTAAQDWAIFILKDVLGYDVPDEEWLPPKMH